MNPEKSHRNCRYSRRLFATFQNWTAIGRIYKRAGKFFSFLGKFRTGEVNSRRKWHSGIYVEISTGIGWDWMIGQFIETNLWRFLETVLRLEILERFQIRCEWWNLIKFNSIIRNLRVVTLSLKRRCTLESSLETGLTRLRECAITSGTNRLSVVVSNQRTAPSRNRDSDKWREDEKGGREEGRAFLQRACFLIKFLLTEIVSQLEEGYAKKGIAAVVSTARQLCSCRLTAFARRQLNVRANR